jgi:uncharacterized protein (TIGR01777 family)
MKKIIIAGATGFVGQFLVPALLESQYQVSVIGRSSEKIHAMFADKVTAISWDELRTQHLQNQMAIINLAGENIADHRWSKRVKQTIIDSRTIPTQRLVDLCLALGKDAPWLLNTSAVGYYGLSGDHLHQPQLVDEQWQQPRQIKDFLSQVAHAWEAPLHAASDAHVPITIMRFGVVLHPKYGMLKKLLPSIKLGLGSILGRGNQMISWIHVEDLVRAIQFLLDQRIYGAINLTSPFPTTQAQLMQSLAHRYHRPCYIRLPSFAVKILFGEMGDTLLLGGQNVKPSRLQEYDFCFRYPTIEDVP